MRTVFWEDGKVKMIDQRLLPHEVPVADDPDEPDDARDDLSAELQSEPSFDKAPRRVEL